MSDFLNKILVALKLKAAPKPKRKYVRKAPAAPKKPKVEKKVAMPANADGSLKQPPWANGQMDPPGQGDSHGIL